MCYNIDTVKGKPEWYPCKSNLIEEWRLIEMTIREYFESKEAKVETFLDRMKYDGEISYVLEKYDNFDVNGLIDWAEENGVDLSATTKSGELILDRWAASYP